MTDMPAIARGEAKLTCCGSIPRANETCQHTAEALQPTQRTALGPDCKDAHALQTSVMPVGASKYT